MDSLIAPLVGYIVNILELLSIFNVHSHLLDSFTFLNWNPNFPSSYCIQIMIVLRKNLLLQFLVVSPSDDDDNEHVGQDIGAGQWVHPFESFQLISRWKKLKVAITGVLYWPDLGGTGQDRRAEILSMRLDWVNWFSADPRQRYCQLSSRPKYIPEVDI